jgi:hypothetical protein
MSNKSTKGYSGTPQAKSRRERVITRLETQLKAGTKPTSELGVSVPLEDKDITRINKELVVLKTRI